MTGLDNILKQIRVDAETSAAQVVLQAQRQANEILEAAKAEADKQIAHIADKMLAQTADIDERAKSAVELEKRKQVLITKQQIINRVIQEAQNSLYDLPDKEYFTVLLKLVERYALPLDGIIVFSKKDLDRLPKDFEVSINQLVKGGSLKVENKAGNIENGFLLVYGGIEENCTFEALFDAAREELQDKVHAILFS